MAGSAKAAIIISRLDPMPPKLVPMSSPASAVKKRRCRERHQRDQIGGRAKQKAGGECRSEAPSQMPNT
jgi:hypothetical protein